MTLQIIVNKSFIKEQFAQKKLPLGEYEGCTFLDCDFTDADISGLTFIDCSFEDSNLSMTKIQNSAFKTVRFINCKLLGLNFNECNPFLLSLSFDHCPLNLASFYKLKLKGIKFSDCDLREVDFTESDLTLSIFENCNLERAIFDNTLLVKADLRTSFNYSIDPTINRIQKSKHSRNGIAGLLDKYDIVIE
jgi:fluoroquinolone resistance protein